MAVIQNLFRIRTAEQAQADTQFLTLFSGRVVKQLPEDDIWDRLIRIESAPGGGKTSLLRLFTPASLAMVYRDRDTREIRELYRELTDLGALVAEQGVAVLGVLVNCHHDYSQISEHEVPEGEKARWFMSLLDARVTLLVLRAALQLAGLRYPGDVARVALVRKQGGTSGRSVDDELSGETLFQQARDTETRIASAISQLGVPRELHENTARLEITRLLTSHELRIDGKLIAGRVLLMFDETHTLALAQRSALQEDLQSHDVGVARWMAMRLTALTPAEAMSEPATDGREYKVVRLEDWRGSQAERWLTEIADKRAIRAVTTINSFGTLLADTLATPGEMETARTAAKDEQESAIALVESHVELFKNWMADAASAASDPLESATRWSRFKILAERRLRRRQAEFDFASIPVTEIDDSASLTEAARLFLSERHKLPYYYGSRKVVQLGYGNAQQLLQVCGDLFDLMLYTGVLTERDRQQLSASQQDRIIRAISQRTLDRLRRDLPAGNDVHALVSAAGQVAAMESHRPTAPYAPGVTGFAISMTDREVLLGADDAADPTTARLRRALYSAISHNVLTPHLDRRTKGSSWMVFYLNRLLCPVFRLPLGLGGYREKPLVELKRWVQTGTPSSARRVRLHD